MRLRLLPDNPEIGWTPLAYLIYLGFFYFDPFLGAPYDLADWVRQIVATVVFLALFFRGFWVRGRRLVPIIVAIVLLGAWAVTFNTGGGVFFIYAAGFLGELGPPRVGLVGVGGILIAVVTCTVLFDLHPGTWIPAAVFTTIIGGINIHYAQVNRRNARLRLAQEEIERLAKADERDRIAREQKDLLGHTLSVITLKSQLAARLMEGAGGGGERGANTAPDRHDRALHEVREVERISREALSEVRRAVLGFRSLKIGIELAKARMALETAGIGVDLETSPYDLHADAESVLALALREAVTNVVRHSRATTCSIRLRQHKGSVELTVEDDGRGARGATGSGLSGMRERVEATGGLLEIGDGERRGTRLRVVVPGQAGPPVGPAALRATSP
ncbi:MAG: sensor histidine kinase [Acidobacteria bacterium]|nr:MAG: sensor histidine kinase [Acidobacteriota bacterium]